jgi:predicted nucleic acid-binding protein
MVLDASIVVSRLVPHDVHHESTRTWLAAHVAGGGMLIAPTLLLAELAGAVARRTANARLARRAVAAVLQLPGLRLVSLDETLARRAATLAGQLRVRGADAVYIAVAAALNLPLATWDFEQRDRAARIVTVFVPERPDH